MSDVTRVLSAMEHGDHDAADQLLPLVYEGLRKLAARQMADEKSGQTLDATGLVHEAYVRLVDQDQQANWNGRGHFYAAAAEAIQISRRTADRLWILAKTWLFRQMSSS